ncbi:MAG: hypothetical protein H0U28_16415 [Nocardioidaceae bacterium]|nr:hypothetical protein [Nocardioidaceae bacterium]
MVVLGVLAALGVLAYNWSQQQYYVAAFEGKVAIYQGVRADIPGLDLDHVYETENLLLSELPGFRRNQVVEGMTAGNLEDARQIVSQLESFARTCATQATESPSPTEATETRPNETARTETPPTETASPRTESATSGPTKGSEPTRTSRAQPTGQNSTLTSPDRTGEGSGDRPRPTERTTRPTEKTDPAEASGPTRPTDPPETEPSDTDEEAAECSGATPVTETTR